MKILIVQHEDSTPSGTTEEWCRLRGVQARHIQADKENFPATVKEDGVIILGGGMNVDQETEYPWLRGEKEFIKRLLSEKTKILGICLGGQLLAECLGARVSKHEFDEKGFDLIHIRQGFHLPMSGSEVPTMQWHGYSFETPKFAECVFSGTRWENQGFVYQDHILGVQFHPEADHQFLEDCYRSLGQPPPMDSLQKLQQMKDWYFKLLDHHFLKQQVTSAVELR